MALLWNEIKKIMNQIRGSQNIFGYKSTVANQTYLFYCFCGKIYFTDKIDRRIKYLWYTLVCCALIMSYTLALLYLLYDEERNVKVMLNVANMIGFINYTTFGFALISYTCDDQITAFIEKIDHNLTNGKDHSVLNSVKQSRVYAGARGMFVSVIAPVFACILVQMFICSLDVVLFYSEDKVKNELYYMSPIPLVRQHGTFGLFIFLDGISAFNFAMCSLQTISAIAVILYWNAVCCNELIDIRDEFYERSCSLMEKMKKCAGVERSLEWNQNFQGAIQRCVVRFQEAILMLNCLRMYFEVFGSLSTVVTFSYNTAALYICSSEEIFVLKIRYASFVMGCTITTFFYYWTGQKIENLIIEVSTAVYSSPWYCSVEVRKNIHILLCQTQAVKNFLIIKVYGILLKNFSRYANGVISYTNILRKLNLK